MVIITVIIVVPERIRSIHIITEFGVYFCFMFSKDYFPSFIYFKMHHQIKTFLIGQVFFNLIQVFYTLQTEWQKTQMKIFTVQYRVCSFGSNVLYYTHFRSKMATYANIC